MMMTTPQHLSDMDMIAELFSPRNLSHWQDTSASSIASSLHREAWLEEVTTRNPPYRRTAQFLNDLDFARLLLGGGRELEISRANHAAYTRHRMEQKQRTKKKKPLERWREHLRLVATPSSDT